MPTASSILHPRFREAVALLAHCHEASRQAREPVCGALLGASGVGKTSVVDHYYRLHPPEETETATRQPVLKVTLQPDARPKGIAADLLLALGDPAWSSGTVQTLTNRAVRLLKHCGVELIVMDEFHHLFDMDRAKVMTKASQWLKVLVVNTGIPVVVCGMPEAEYVLGRAYRTAFQAAVDAPLLHLADAAGQKEFCGMLKRLDESLPLAEVSGLAEPEMAGRFYLASRGVPDYLMTLVRGAVVEAINQQNPRIELADLARVFERSLAQQRVLAEQSNPFIGTLDQAALDGCRPPTRQRWPASVSRRGPPAAGHVQSPRRIILEDENEAFGRVPSPPGPSQAASRGILDKPSPANVPGHGLRKSRPRRFSSLRSTGTTAPSQSLRAGPILSRAASLLLLPAETVSSLTVHHYAPALVLIKTGKNRLATAIPRRFCDTSRRLGQSVPVA